MLFSRMLHVRKASCVQKTCDFVADLWRLPLAGIAPERAHGPERAGGVDPGGFGGFLHLSLHVWVDLRGRRRQLSARHGSLPPRVLPPEESGQYASSSCCENTAGSLSDRRRRRKPHPRFCHWCCAKTEGGRLPPCRITGSSDTVKRASACPLAYRELLHP